MMGRTYLMMRRQYGVNRHDYFDGAITLHKASPRRANTAQQVLASRVTMPLALDFTAKRAGYIFK